jgi:hypothetical protein
MIVNQSSRKYLVLMGALIMIVACPLTGTGTGGTSDLEQTQIALGVELTSIALEHDRQTAEAASPAEPAQPAQESQPQVQPTYTPLPTYTPFPTNEPTHTETPLPQPTNPPAMSLEEKIRGSNVLIFEDIWGDMTLSGDKRVSQAVDSIGFSGGKVINVGDAMGNFKSHLLSGTAWDLIIISAEVRSGIQGEFWQYMLDHLNNNVAMIAEVWYIDDTALGMIAPVLTKCGIQLHKEWVRNPGDNVLDFSILNLVTDHPIFNTPNSGVTLVTPNIYWMDDAGDLLQIGTGGDARLLAGLFSNRKTDYGVIAECLGGTVIFQTFSTHDYRSDQTVPLWVNYINYTLTNHYQSQE